MALYRTYRPTRLDEVVGQEHVTGPLRRALDNDRVHHAYLFSGPRGCGKTSTARILARSLNCEQGPTPDPCGVCQSCQDLSATGPGSIDVIELDAASHGGVDDTRDLRERAMFAPASSRYKIYIIDEAHMVSTAGFNALLKLVEEPPEHVRFIFATTEVDKVLPTIRSRTHNYTFRLVPSKTLQQHLASVCEAEGVPAEPAALALIARAGAGSVRDSLSVLGQVISGCGPEGITYAEAVAQLGMTDGALLDATIDALSAQDGAALFTVIDQVIDAGHDPRRFVTDLLERFRDLIVLHNVPHAAEVGLIEAPEDLLATLVEQSARFGPHELVRAADVTSAGLSELKGATAPRLHLELVAARLLLPASDLDEASLRTRLDQLERRMASTHAHDLGGGQVAIPAAAVASPTPSPQISSEPESVAQPPRRPARTSAPASTPAPPAPPAPPRRLSEVAPSTASSEPAPLAPEPETVEPAPATPPAPAAPAAGPTLEQFAAMWAGILEGVKAYSRVAWMTFDGSVPISLSDGVLAVAVDSPGKVNNLRSSGHDERLRQAIVDVMKADVRVDVVLMPDRVAGNAARAASAAASAAGTADPDQQTSPAETSDDTYVPSLPEPDLPSPDDPDVDDTVGVELVMRELGGTTIGEIEN